MKDILIIIVLFAAMIFSLPLLKHLSPVRDTNGLNEAAEPDFPAVFPDKVRIYLTETDDIAEISAAEYIEGCLAAQIPINYHPEALKAQASASATYALRLMGELTGSGILPDGADISDDKQLCQPYMPEDKRIETYGNDYAKYREVIQTAAAYGVSHIITYDGEPIYAVYHSVSAGGTCPSDCVWGRALPYLRRADSPWDRAFPHFECRNEIKAEEIRSALAHYDSGIDIPVDPARWFTEMNADENGYVISVNIGKNKFSGGDLWRILGLRSTAFTVSYENGIFTFVTRGFGHGAGLSQFGADAMAASGSTAEQIIAHYYIGASLT